MSAVRTSVHLTNAYHPASGGIRTFYDALLASADRSSRIVHLVVPADRDALEQRGAGAWVHYLDAGRAPGFDRRYRLLTPRHYLSRRSAVTRLLADIQPDVVEVCDKYSLVALAWRLRRCRGPRPTVVGASTERLDDNVAAFVTRGRVGRAAAAAYLRHVYAPAFDAHIANSDYTAAELAAAGAGPVQVCGMGVDVTTFGTVTPDAALRERLLAATGGTPDSALVLYAGRLSPEKHVDVLIDAVSELAHGRSGQPAADVRLVLVGEGPAAAALQRRAAVRCPGRVAAMPHLTDRAALARHYAAADVFVHPNPREPFGIGPLEAMAAGTAVVLPRAGGVLAYADDGNAWLAEPGPSGLAAAIRRALAAGGTSPILDCARRTAHAHAWPLVIGRYLAALDALHDARLALLAPARRYDTARPCVAAD